MSLNYFSVTDSKVYKEKQNLTKQDYCDADFLTKHCDYLGFSSQISLEVGQKYWLVPNI